MTDSPATVMQVIPRLDAGGAERTTIEINKALIEAGWRSIVVSAGGRYSAVITDDGGTHITLPVHSKNPIRMGLNRNALIKIAKAHHVNIIHARSRAPAWSCWHAAIGLNLPMVTTYHGAYNNQNRLKRFYNSAMVRSDRIIANSHFTAEQILATFSEAHLGPRHKRLSDRLQVIYRGADLHHFDPDHLSPERIARVTNGWDQSDEISLLDPSENTRPPFRLLLPARMSRWKGHEVAFNAIKSIAGAGQGVNLRLILCGGFSGGSDTNLADTSDESAFEKELRSLVKQFGVDDLTHFSGYCEDMAAAYGWADAVLVPSTRPEAFGRVVVEAGAMGVPVIASDHGGARETVLNGETGCLVEPGNSQALANAILQLQEKGQSARKTMGKAAAQHVQKNFSIEAMCGKTLALYQDVLSKGQGGENKHKRTQNTQTHNTKTH